MEFTAVFRVFPSFMFGLPDEDKVVSPTGRKTTYRDHQYNIHGEIIEYGTLSEYRQENDAISISTRIGVNRLEVRDNIFSLVVESGDQFEARKRARAIFDRFILHVSLERMALYRTQLIQLRDSSGRLYPEPEGKGRGFYFYNLSKMSSKILIAAGRADIDDQVLNKALAYFQHSQFLFDSYFHHEKGETTYRREQREPLSSISLAITSAYLSLWKGITVILGDPSSDKDYQSRFRDLGFPKSYWTEKVRPLYDIRNKYDVAHYSLDAEAIDKVREAYSLAERICRECIVKYVDNKRAE